MGGFTQLRLESRVVGERATGGGSGERDTMVELADNWLNLARLSLFVFTDNAHAIRLYERAGFVIEGTMPRRGFGAGAWMDAYMMGRLHDRGAGRATPLGMRAGSYTGA
jgi:L-amino acid N-acyltransferase YncA